MFGNYPHHESTHTEDHSKHIHIIWGEVFAILILVECGSLITVGSRVINQLSKVYISRDWMKFNLPVDFV